MQTIDGYGRPTHWRPTWYVPALVFQGGIPRTRTASQVGSGVVYPKEPGPPGQPYIYPQAYPLQSMTGGGILPTAPASLAMLMQQTDLFGATTATSGS